MEGGGGVRSFYWGGVREGGLIGGTYTYGGGVGTWFGVGEWGGVLSVT